MAVTAKKRRDDRIRRHNRVRKNLRGTAQRPRIAVFRSNKHISAQVIDDIAGVTLAAVSTTESALRGDVNSNIDAASKAGALLAERAKAAGLPVMALSTCPNKNWPVVIFRNSEI